MNASEIRPGDRVLWVGVDEDNLLEAHVCPVDGVELPEGIVWGWEDDVYWECTLRRVVAVFRDTEFFRFGTEHGDDPRVPERTASSVLNRDDSVSPAQVRIDPEVFAAVRSASRPGDRTPNDVLRRVFGLPPKARKNSVIPQETER